MYFCEYCDAEFDEPEEYFETHGLDSAPYEKFSVCPYCYSRGYIKKE